MARTLNRLSTLGVSRAKSKGLIADGGGLYLRVSDSGTKSWVFRYGVGGKLRDMGLGESTQSRSQKRERWLQKRASFACGELIPSHSGTHRRLPQGLQRPLQSHSPKPPKITWPAMRVLGATPLTVHSGSPHSKVTFIHRSVTTLSPPSALRR